MWLEEPDRATRIGNLSTWLSTLDSRSRATVREAWSRLIEVRERHLGGVIEFDFESDMVFGLSEGLELAEMVEAFANGELGFTSGKLGLKQWKELRTHIQRWAHFTKHPAHEGLRMREIALLEHTFGLLAPPDRAELLPTFRPEGMVDPSPGAAFVEMIARLQAASREVAVELSISRFEIPDGLDVLWGERRGRLYEMLLLDPDSPVFTDTDSYSRLRSIAETAPRSATVQKNFLTFFRQLAYGATDGGSFSSSDCQRLLANEELVRIMWNAAVAQPLNPRVAGSLRERRMRLAPTIVTPDAMQLPEWWLTFEEIGYWRDETHDSGQSEETDTTDK